jgi:hypothetical protein
LIEPTKAVVCRKSLWEQDSGALAEKDVNQAADGGARASTKNIYRSPEAMLCLIVWLLALGIQ